VRARQAESGPACRVADAEDDAARQVGFWRGGEQGMLSNLMTRLVLPVNAKANVSRPRRKSEHRPSVSIVIPCYNYGRYLPECVGSVLDQQGVSVDVLVIDDASPDGSAEVARRLAADDPRVRAVCHEENRGHIATYNEGLAQASGDYTALLSADDRLTPGSLARATSLMEAHPSVGLTYGFSVDFTDAHLPPARTVASNWIIWPGQHWITHRCKSGQNVLRSPEAVMRTSVLHSIGYCRTDLPHTADFEMWMRAATVSDVGYIAGADQAYYRLHDQNMHHSNFNVLADISGRLQSFEILLNERSRFLSDPSSMRNTVHRVLAREALDHAISAYARGVADREPVADYAAFALSVWPDSRHLGRWRILCRLEVRRGSRGRHPSLATREAIRNVKYALRWWRWRWAGVY
jgi:glycosyltransferase involved in cell wall biosynthesis